MQKNTKIVIVNNTLRRTVIFKYIEPVDMEIKHKSKSPLALLVKYFLEGLFVLLPLSITIAVIVWLVGLLSKQLGPKIVIGGYLVNIGAKKHINWFNDLIMQCVPLTIYTYRYSGRMTQDRSVHPG